MDSGEAPLAGPGVTSGRAYRSSPLLERQAAQSETGALQGKRQWWVPAAWTAGILVIFGFFLTVALKLTMDSDGANNVLQAWDLIHGNVLLHHWIIGDATYYTFDLPILAVSVAIFGMHPVALHVASSVILLIVAVSAMAAARADSSGAAIAARCGVVVAVIAAGFATYGSTWMLLAQPDHTGTAAVLLIAFLVVDRALGRRYALPLLFVILCAGQLSDAIVLYIGVPAIVLMSLYRARAARKLRSVDTAVALTALVSVPATLLIRHLMLRMGAYVMVSPRVQLAPLSMLQHNAYLTGRGIGILFGAQWVPGSPLGIVGNIFGVACMLAALYGFAKVVLRWRSATRMEQLLCLGIVLNIAAYLFSTLPVPTNPRELIAIVPFGAILAARALVPARIVGSQRTRAVILVAAACAALLPLTAATTRPAETPTTAEALVSWLEAHGYTYGIGGYWDSAAVTVVSGNRVQVRAVRPYRGMMAAEDWETRADWYNAKQHYAAFAIAGVGSYTPSNVPASVFEYYLGKPTKIYNVGGQQILIYQGNLLRHVRRGPIPAR